MEFYTISKSCQYESDTFASLDELPEEVKALIDTEEQ